jgi:RNA polymerase sigma factor (sigma-70 family)
MTGTTLIDDVTIIDEILAGNKEKYELLMRRYNTSLYRIAKGILTDEQEIEDAMQEAYIKAYRQLANFERRSTFKTWLTRILLNECLMKKKTRKTSGGRVRRTSIAAAPAGKEHARKDNDEQRAQAGTRERYLQPAGEIQDRVPHA